MKSSWCLATVFSLFYVLGAQATQSPSTSEPRVKSTASTQVQYLSSPANQATLNSRPNAPTRTKNTKRYIVELTEASLWQERRRLDTLIPIIVGGKSTNPNNPAQASKKTSLNAYKRHLNNAQKSLISDALHKGQFVALKSQLSKAVNAIVVEATDTQAKSLSARAEVKRVIEDVRMTATVSEGTELIGAPQLWQGSDGIPALTGSDIKIAILDTGIDYTHPDLGGCFGPGCKVVSGYDFVYEDDDPMDVQGHGTHVAGIAAANGSIVGVAPDALLIAVKVLGDDGAGWTSDIIEGIEWAVDPDGDPGTDDGADVINMSLGGPMAPDDPLIQATNQAVEAGVTVVVAAGNNGVYGDIAQHSPAAAELAITVGSITVDGELSDFTSKGPVYEVPVLKPEVVAPGSNIYSTMPSGNFASLSGTSMASPYVAGAVALLKQWQPDISPAHVKQRLMAGARDLGFDPYAQGSGVIDMPATITNLLLSEEGGVIYGRVDQEQDQLSGLITLTNASDENVNLSIDIEADWPQGLELVPTQTSVSIGPNQVHELGVQLNISGYEQIPFPQHPTSNYFASLVLTADKQQHRIPITVEKSLLLSLINESNVGVSFALHGQDGNQLLWSNLYAGQTTQLSLPPQQVYLYASYDRQDLTALPVIQQASDNDQEHQVTNGVRGFETLSVEVEQDQAIRFSSEYLQHLYGPDQIVDKQGNSAIESASTQLSGIFTEFTREGRPFATYNIQAGESDAIDYWAFGRLSNATQTQAYRVDKVEPEDGASAFIHQWQPVSEQSLPAPNTLALGALTSSLFTANDALVNFEKRWAIDTSLFGFVSLAPNLINTDEIEYYLAESTGDLTARVVLVDVQEDEETFNPQDVVASPWFSSVEHSLVNGNFQAEALHFSGDSWGADGELWLSLFNAPFTDRWGNQYFGGSFLSARQFCSNQLVDEQEFNLFTYAAANNPDCLDLSFEFSAVSLPEKLKTTMSLSAQPESLSAYRVAGPTRITALDYDQPTVAAALHTVKPQLRIAFNQWQTIDDLQVRILDGSNDWQSVSATLEDGQSAFLVNLPHYTEPTQLSVELVYSIEQTSHRLLLSDHVTVFTLTGEEDDSDADGIVNYLDDDIDGDGISNDLELRWGLNPYNPFDASEDLDNDGIGTIEELRIGTSPEHYDSDGDGISDGDELAQGSDPLDASSSERAPYVLGDYNGDGRADIVTSDINSGRHELITQAGSQLLHEFWLWGENTPVVGDFDGDRVSDPAVWLPNEGSLVIYNSANQQEFWHGSGVQDAVLAAADYDGDGITDVGFFSNVLGQWEILLSANNTYAQIETDNDPTDTPVRGDFDGDGVDDIAYHRSRTGQWFIRESVRLSSINDADVRLKRVRFGAGEGVLPTPADFDGDSVTDLAVWSSNDQRWQIQLSRTGRERKVSMGNDGTEIPLAADYDGDGKADLALYHPATSTVTIQYSSDASVQEVVITAESPFLLPLAQASSALLDSEGTSGTNVSEPQTPTVLELSQF